MVTAAEVTAESELEHELDREYPKGASSYLNATPPHLIRSRRTRYTWRNRRPRRTLAVLMLALLVVVGLALTSVIVGLVRVGLSWSSGQAAAASPLIAPAPALAGGLVRREAPMRSAITQQLIARFTRRFTDASGSESGQPAGLYREPGVVNLATNEQGWVMYLGHNSAANLGAPAVTIGRVMAILIESSSPGSSWSAAPGPRGGNARCAIHPFGTTTVALCAWATEHTIGALMSPIADTRGNELAALMPLMRLDLQPGWPTRKERPTV